MSRRNLFPTMSAAQVVSRIGKTTKRRNPAPAAPAPARLPHIDPDNPDWGQTAEKALRIIFRGTPAGFSSRSRDGYASAHIAAGPNQPRVYVELFQSDVEPRWQALGESGWTRVMDERFSTPDEAMARIARFVQERVPEAVPTAPAPAAPARFPRPVGMFVWLSAGEESSLQAIIEDLAWSEEYSSAGVELIERGSDWRPFARDVAEVLIRNGYLTSTSDTTYRAVKDITNITFNNAVNQAFAALAAPTMAQQLAQAAFGGGRSRTAPAPAPAPQADREFPQNITLFGRDAEIAYEDFIPDLEVHYAASVDTAMRNGLSSRQFAKAVVKELAKLDMVEDRGYIKVLRAIQGYHVTEAVNRARNSILPESERPKPLALPRSPATSAYAFPKRCVGQPRNYNVDYMFTLIAPLCKMPLRFGSDDSNYKYYGYSPDGLRAYVGGYHGQYDTRMFNGMSFMRQHMLPGVLDDKDFGKGVGPACYMAGPLRVATLNDYLAGTYSMVGGRTTEADAAWYNLVQHKTAVQELINAREVTLKTYGLLNFATKADPNHYATRPDDVAPIVAKKLGQIQPAKLTVQAADAIYDYIYRKHILGLGIVLHIDPKHEQKILAGMNLTAPIVPPPGIWSELDLSQTDTNSLGEFLHYCSSNFAKYGNLTAGDYMRGALEALKQNPSSPMSDEELKTELAQYKPAKSVVQRKKRNPEVDADLSQETRLLSDFLNDEDWGEGGSVQNPAPRTFIPPPAVAAEARKGITLRASQPPSNRCCTPVGLRRAVQLANRQPVSETTLRRMKAYFDRHYGPDSRGKGWGVDSRGWQAHLCWGGDAGRKWVESILGGR